MGEKDQFLVLSFNFKNICTYMIYIVQIEDTVLGYGLHPTYIEHTTNLSPDVLMLGSGQALWLRV